MSVKLTLATGAATALLLLAPAAAFAADLSGTDGPDRLLGTNGKDKVTARGGADLVRTYGGPDDITGGPGADRIYAGGGPDVVWGGRGRDLIDSGQDSAVDKLLGGPRADRIFASYNDQVWGGYGDDTITFTYGAHGAVNCGPGHDTLVYNQPTDGVDVIGCEVVKVVSAG